MRGGRNDALCFIVRHGSQNDQPFLDAKVRPHQVLGPSGGHFAQFGGGELGSAGRPSLPLVVAGSPGRFVHRQDDGPAVGTPGAAEQPIPEAFVVEDVLATSIAGPGYGFANFEFSQANAAPFSDTIRIIVVVIVQRAFGTVVLLLAGLWISLPFAVIIQTIDFFLSLKRSQFGQHFFGSECGPLLSKIVRRLAMASTGRR